MRTFSLFTGVGGFEQAFPTDWEIVGFSEIDKYASQVLKYRFPNTKNYGDITKIEWESVPDFDLLTGGSPCQDFSIAGKRRGLKGSRSSLAWEFIRALRSKKPRYFIWENVKGVLSSRSGWDFANLISAFSESGYSLWWQVLNAKDFGVPQNRERVFVIGFRNENPPEVFFEPKDSGQIEIIGSTKPEGSNRIGQRDRTFSTNGIMRSMEATDYKQPPQILMNLTPNERQGSRVYDPKGLAQSLTANTGGKGGKTGLYIVAQRGRNPENPKSRKSGLPTEQMLEPNLNGISNALTSVEKDNYVMEVANCVTPDAYLTRGERNRDENGKAVLTSMNERRIRKLMPIECERLMGWADNWTKYGINEKGEKVEISDSQRYKMCGNGVVSNVVKTIIDSIK